MLLDLQNHLADIYQADCGQQVTDFLITDRALATALGEQQIHESVEETVLVAEDDSGLAMSVFLDEALLSRLAECDPLRQLRSRELADLAVVLEGLSHFNYLSWCAVRDRSVTLLELELQAEVDKYVATRSLANSQNKPELARKLHQWMFDEVSFRPSLAAHERRRYATASDYAARFCHHVEERLDSEPGLQELRHFYRLSQAQKISHIHSQAWT